MSHPGDREESRDGGRRVLLVPPLGVIFVVRDADQTVFVIGVWGFAKKSSSSRSRKRGARCRDPVDSR
jgi:hypothetical protein